MTIYGENQLHFLYQSCRTTLTTQFHWKQTLEELQTEKFCDCANKAPQTKELVSLSLSLSLSLSHRIDLKLSRPRSTQGTLLTTLPPAFLGLSLTRACEIKIVACVISSRNSNLAGDYPQAMRSSFASTAGQVDPVEGPGHRASRRRVERHLQVDVKLHVGCLKSSKSG